jgi:methionyl aminopeptidase
MHAARAGAPLNGIGAAVEATVTESGYSVSRELMGHGIGRRIHEPPDVPNYQVPQLAEPLTRGLVITIEPIIPAGEGSVLEAGDGWTFRTADGAWSSPWSTRSW